MAERETNYANLVREAEAAAALRLRRGVRGGGMMPGRQEGATTAFLRSMEPNTPAEAAFAVATALPLGIGIPARIGAKLAAPALGALGLTLTPDEAQASRIKAVKGLLSPAEAKAAFQSAVKSPTVLPSAFDRPLFDYSRLHEVPNVPQSDLPRPVPARGVPERALELDRPENVKRINAVVEEGIKKGGLRWYNTMPLREGWIGEVGHPNYYNSFMDYTGATSPRARPPLNARTASYYNMLDELGLPFPQPVKVGSNWSMPPGNLPEGYGGLAQAQNAINAAAVRGGGWQSPYLLEHPKPPSFTQNLRGNYQPVTIDYLNTAMLGLRDTKGRIAQEPGLGSYGFLERLQQREAPKIGIAPAQYQSSGWIEQAGGGEYSKPFLQVVEDRVKATAREYGLTPEQTLRMFYRRQMPIALGGAAALPALAPEERP